MRNFAYTALAASLSLAAAIWSTQAKAVVPIDYRVLHTFCHSANCGDGQFLFLATLFSYFFQRAVRAMGLEVALAEDVFPDDVTTLMEARFRQKPRDEWLAIMRDADVPAAPVSPREDWLRSDLIANNDMRAVLKDPELMKALASARPAAAEQSDAAE